MVYIAVVPNYWARGKTVAEAKAGVRKIGGSSALRAKTPIVVYMIEGDDEPYADPIHGQVMAKKGAKATLVERKNMANA